MFAASPANRVLPVTMTSSIVRYLVLGCAVALFVACSPSSDAPRLAALPAGGDFVLQGPAGTVDTRQLRGKLLLIYFGYANCPDICPASLAVMNQALNEMTPTMRSQIQPLMVSVDPERDTPEKLVAYTSYFHPSLIGLVGSPEETATVAKAFGAGYMRQPTRTDGSYAVDHSGITYVVDKSGKLVATVPIGMSASEFSAIIRKHL